VIDLGKACSNLLLPPPLSSARHSVPELLRPLAPCLLARLLACSPSLREGEEAMAIFSLRRRKSKPLATGDNAGGKEGLSACVGVRLAPCPVHCFSLMDFYELIPASPPSSGERCSALARGYRRSRSLAPRREGRFFRHAGGMLDCLRLSTLPRPLFKAWLFAPRSGSKLSTGPKKMRRLCSCSGWRSEALWMLWRFPTSK
jgi:hypothetical protein